MEKLEAELTRIRLQLKLITTFSEYNVTLLKAITDQYRGIVEQLCKSDPVLYGTSRDKVILAISKLDLLSYTIY